jgi:excisionase family DNA binding protein
MLGMTEEDRKRLKGGGVAVVEALAVKPTAAAAMLGQSRSAIYRLIHSRHLIAVKAGHSTLILVSSIHRYLESLPPFGRSAS